MCYKACIVLGVCRTNPGEQSQLLACVRTVFVVQGGAEPLFQSTASASGAPDTGCLWFLRGSVVAYGEVAFRLEQIGQGRGRGFREEGTEGAEA